MSYLEGGRYWILRSLAAGVAVVFFLAQISVAPAQQPDISARQGTVFAPTAFFNPPLLCGLKVYPNEPFRLDFIVDKGASQITDNALQGESLRLIKYFLAGLTVPEGDLWVNLSPYEGDRIIADAFGQSEMGRDLLAQDYLLKQIMSSFLYPEGSTGRKFWAEVYAEAYKKYGTTDIPVDTFNKVWIVPAKAVVFENQGSAYVAESRLKVLLESDYGAMRGKMSEVGASAQAVGPESQELAKDVVRSVVLPVLEKEVNEGQHFVHLRQVYSALILAAWYKRKITESLLSAVYVDRNKTAGVQQPDPDISRKIWQQYVESFKTGVFDYVREEVDALSGEMIPRKYFSGGARFDMSGMEIVHTMDAAMTVARLTSMVVLAVQLFVAVPVLAADIDGPGAGPARVEQMTDAFLDKMRLEPGLAADYRAAVDVMQRYFSEDIMRLIISNVDPLISLTHSYIRKRDAGRDDVFETGVRAVSRLPKTAQEIMFGEGFGYHYYDDFFDEGRQADIIRSGEVLSGIPGQDWRLAVKEIYAGADILSSASDVFGEELGKIVSGDFRTSYDLKSEDLRNLLFRDEDQMRAEGASGFLHLYEVVQGLLQQYPFLFDVHGGDGRHAQKARDMLRQMPDISVLLKSVDRTSRSYEEIVQANMLVTQYYLASLAMTAAVVPVNDPLYAELVFKISQRAEFAPKYVSSNSDFAIGGGWFKTHDIRDNKQLPLLLRMFWHELGHNRCPRWVQKGMGEFASDVYGFAGLESFGYERFIEDAKDALGYGGLKSGFTGEHELGRGHVKNLSLALKRLGVPLDWKKLAEVVEKVYQTPGYEVYDYETGTLTLVVLSEYLGESSEQIRVMLDGLGRSERYEISVKGLLDRVDRAQSASDLGGIDLNPVGTVLDLVSQGERIRFHVDPVDIESYQRAPGFLPVVLKVTPMGDLKQFLGAN